MSGVLPAWHRHPPAAGSRVESRSADDLGPPRIARFEWSRERWTVRYRTEPLKGHARKIISCRANSCARVGLANGLVRRSRVHELICRAAGHEIFRGHVSLGVP